MKRPWLWLIGIGGALVVVAAGLIWLTILTVRADRHRLQVEARAEQEQRIRLALWRMDTMLAPIVAREAARPWWSIAPDWPVAEFPASSRNAAPMASPDYVKYHFHWPVGGTISSPQLSRRTALGPPLNAAGNDTQPTLTPYDNSHRPPAVQQTAQSATPPESAVASGPAVPQELKALEAELDPAELLAMLPTETFPSYDPWTAVGDGADELSLNWSPRNALTNRRFFAGNSASVEPSAKGAFQGATTEPVARVAQPLSVPEDLESRSARYQVQAAQSYLQQREVGAQLPIEPRQSTEPAVSEGISQALWLGERLILARRIASSQNQVAIQGCELDWNRLKAELMAEAAGLVDQVDLQPVPSSQSRPGPDVVRRELQPGAHQLAGLPIQLVAGTFQPPSPAWTPIELAWLVGWVAYLLAACGIFSLFASLVSLNEKRASFVSAVTHELRTPLTTFRLYSQMLARDMVPPPARAEYLASLCAEADRLSHLIDNVLTYARLERGRSHIEIGATEVGMLMERIRERMAARARQAEMELVYEIEPQASAAVVATDAGMVEQILFNLVDNAAKYGAGAADRRIHCRARLAAEGRVWLEVADHGPGLSASAARQLFRPFSKSAEQAAASAPGVGLGLALSRRLARQIGGDLQLVAFDEQAMGESPSPGCTMRLTLPLASHP
jgi:signal transduction histidine kinase